MHRNCDTEEVTMKTATFPSIRVEPELREAAENVLQEGETLSAFVEQSIREGIERRRLQSEFIARGLASRDDARRTGEYVSAADVLERLGRRLEALRDGKRPTR
ncbi:Prevent-host-death protein [Burkholderia vietnamiensis]|jgi:predicted transcriptional regulator|uniref:YlcI/YnfO family protein n=1 Tax=Burkholderia vietnamiensis TaxID=60552 RepID=UPI001CB5DCDA|nr:Prevent-host-death protein [Burkholderia vietnamiensis]